MAEGREPKLIKKRHKLLGARPNLSFEVVGREWPKSQLPKWTQRHAGQVLRSLADDLVTDLGMFDVKDVDKPLLLAVLRNVENGGAIETARRLRQRAEAIFDFVEGSGAIDQTPTLRVVRAMQPVLPKSPLPALVDISASQSLIEAFPTSPAKGITKAASRFLVLAAQRPGNVQQARWAHFHGIVWNKGQTNDARWIIPAAAMKGELARRKNAKFHHEVPLPPKAVESLLAIRRNGGRPIFIFGGRGRPDVPLSDKSLVSPVAVSPMPIFTPRMVGDRRFQQS